MLETLHRHQRQIVVTALLFVIAGAWLYILLGVGMSDSAVDMTAMIWRFGDMAMARPEWTPAYALAVFFMWWLMMVAMMLPGAMPTLLLYAAVIAKRTGSRSPYLPTALFSAGYLAAWGLFSVFAAGAQALLDTTGLLSPMMQGASAWLSGGLLAVAGFYQLSPLKNACLSHCRSPLSFIVHRWRPTTAGAFRMGLEHGLYCTGCCWALMTLLFVVGVMNLFWIGAIALYVLVEKTAPRGVLASRLIGLGLIATGAFVVLQAS